MVLRNRAQPRSYALGKRIAAGGMGEVYEATTPEVNLRLAVKRVLEAGDSDADLKLMFLREVAVAATLEHQNVVEVIDAGQAGPDLYLVMEFVEGPSLAEVMAVLRQNGRVLPVDIAVGIATQIAHGLAHAHERSLPDGTPLGIVHRDVAPENVLIGNEGLPKLVDFGLAKLSGHSLTQPGVVRGRPRCLSPEQARGDKVDAKSDLFSLGAMLFEMLSGQALYPNEQMATLLWKVAAGDYDPIRPRMPGVDPDLVQIIESALAADPEKRTGSARRLIRALDSFRASRGLPLSKSGVARVVKAVWPSVQAMRAQNLDGSVGELEGRRLSLPGEKIEASTPSPPAAPKPAPTSPPMPRSGGTPPITAKEAVLSSTVPAAGRNGSYPKPNATSSTSGSGDLWSAASRASPAAGWAEPLPVPEAPAKGLSMGPNETAWWVYLVGVFLVAMAAFFGIYSAGNNGGPSAKTAEADVTR